MQIYLQKHLRRKRLLNIVSLLLVMLSLMVVFCALIYKTSGNVKYLANTSDSAVCLSAKPLSTASETDEKTAVQTVEMNNFTQDNAKMQTFSAQNEAPAPKCESIRVLSGSKVIRMPIEEYVTGCVFGEMPLSFESQALMAQCIAARTFAVRQASGFSKHKNADVCTSPACCQNFVSVDNANVGKENLNKLTHAVNVTKGMIILYGGEPIEAVYHASSGGNTLDSEKVWGGRVEYLRGVKAPDGEEAISVSAMGHRVGMSQHGANLLAKEGKGYAGILKYYYSGVNLGFIR